MAYQLNSVTIRTNNSVEGMQKIEDVWKDIMSGKLPILFDSEHQFQPGTSPVSKYCKYAGDESRDYDLCIMGVESDFFSEMEKAVCAGRYKKYEESGDDMGLCTKRAWENVWNDQKSGSIKRAFSEDYESTVPGAYTKDAKAHCYLYISVA